MLLTIKGEKLEGEFISSTQLLQGKKTKKKEKGRMFCPSAFAAAAGAWAGNVVLLFRVFCGAVCWSCFISMASQRKGCSSSLCGFSPHQIGTCPFPPHQCWFTSSCPYVIPQKEKHRQNKMVLAEFVPNILWLVLWHMIRVSKQKSKATAPVYCERAVLSNFSIYVPAYNMATHMD